MVRRDRRVAVRVLGAGPAARREDRVVVEAPLEVGVQGSTGPRQVVGVTLRTPGDDLDLAVGWLASQGLLRTHEDLRGARWCTDADTSRVPGPLASTIGAVMAGAPVTTAQGRSPGRTPPGVVPVDPPRTGDAVTVDVRGPTPQPRTDPRVVHAGCGVCGDDLLDDLAARGARRAATGVTWNEDEVLALTDLLATGQPTFARTGGLHAALRVRDGAVVHAAEDVGRHNAVDKLVGHGLRTSDPDWGGDALVLSGRVGYELVAKAAVVGCPLVVGVGATTSLAIDVAERFGTTLVAFARDGRANVHTHPERLVTARAATPLPGSLT